MGKFFFALVFMISLGIEARAQNLEVELDNLVFESEAEQKMWTLGKSNPYYFFQAVEPYSTEGSQVWNDLLHELDIKASKKSPDINLLRLIFQKTHQRLLKKYVLHSSFNAMLKEGKYDCVSGTAAMGLLLDRYGYDYELVETDYHVFIKVNLNNQTIILETTLPVGGMITLPSEVEKYLSTYLPKKESTTPSNFNQRLAGPKPELSETSIFRKVNLTELAGLQYYNDAIAHFNSQDYGKAVNQLSKAYLLYPSDRIDGLRALSINLAYKSYGYELRK
jgi:hypothetical protein